MVPCTVAGCHSAQWQAGPKMGDTREQQSSFRHACKQGGVEERGGGGHTIVTFLVATITSWQNELV